LGHIFWIGVSAGAFSHIDLIGDLTGNLIGGQIGMVNLDGHAA